MQDIREIAAKKNMNKTDETLVVAARDSFSLDAIKALVWSDRFETLAKGGCPSPSRWG
jgi:hypothetical protein